MATIALSAAGTAVGSAFGGSVLGLSGAALGRAAGASLGGVIDRKLLGTGSEPVETGRVKRFRLTGASEGAPVPQVWGRQRVSGQVIWASRFRERVATSGGGGKGGPRRSEVREYHYTVSLAIALCEGEIARVGRIWADGAEIAPAELNLRVYTGSEEQLPDSAIEAIEGAGRAPAYRGIAYVVLEDLALEPYGNRVPQFSFEVSRPADAEAGPAAAPLGEVVRGVALVPGTGEYALATTPVHYSDGPGANRSANVNSPSGETDFETAIDVLGDELPRAEAVSLVVSWFGDDLRCGECSLRPEVEQKESEGEPIGWVVSGVSRSTAKRVPYVAERPVYGGTPADRAVREAIVELNARGYAVTFYPFILMQQLAGNALPDPLSGGTGQPVLPWRGRITTSLAPGVAGSPDGTAAAAEEVAAFFGSAVPSDFSVEGSTVAYAGSEEWSFRRFILHYAHLCAAAGGVAAFCIGSEMRGLTRIRGAGRSFPAVAEMRALAADVREVLGPETEISYAADWSEYAGYTPEGSSDLFFPLDPLWADANIDFVGIDNYMPLSDWRDGEAHADSAFRSIYSLDYLQANIEGGEGYDWYYATAGDAAAQVRTPITDGGYGEPWVFRVKDMRNWWANVHHQRIDGVRETAATAWVAQSKPIRFTEFGCAAIDKGTNEPNKFLDPKSSESRPPKYSDGSRDDLIQAQYLRAVTDYWEDPANNPVSPVYGGPMLDMARAHVWSWDTRPFPYFPNNLTLWADGANYSRGHWLNGRSSSQALAGVVQEICAASGVTAVETERLHGLVRGYSVDGLGGGRAALQPLMLAYGFDAAERDGKLVFRSRTGRVEWQLGKGVLARTDEQEHAVAHARAPVAETEGRVRLNYVEAEGDYAVRAAEAIFPGEESFAVSQSDLPVALTHGEGRAVVERWLAEARVARETVRFALPPSALYVGAGEVVELDAGTGPARYRVDRVDAAEAQQAEAVRVEPAVYTRGKTEEERPTTPIFRAPVPLYPVFLDLPLLTGDGVPHAPHLAVTARPWPGAAAVYSAASDAGYTFNRRIEAPSVIGETETPLAAARPGLWDRGPALRVKLYGGELASATREAVLNGANAAAIGDGSTDTWEVFQFAEAAIVAPDTYELGLRLRGQLGTDAIMPESWPAGSRFVLLDGRPRQLELAGSARGLERHYRIGPAQRPYDDPVYVHRAEAFDGIGLRPFSPTHLRAVRNGTGDTIFRWVRRTRIDGDSWASFDVPLGEAFERYSVRVVSGGTLRREATASGPAWTYTAAERAADGVESPYALEVAQISDRFGPGPYERIVIDD